MEKKFRIISILFVLGCILYYGGRFGYFYNKYNKKATNSSTSEVLGITIQKKGTVANGDGLYNSNGELIFKGKEVDNYLIYSNILFRIVKVNSDNSIVLTTNSSVADLAWSNGESTYDKSYIYNWLNKNGENTGIFESKLNKESDFLVKTTTCLDSVDDIKSMTCNKKQTSFVTLLSISDYLNSKTTDSYINSSEKIWLSNTKSDKKIWYINNKNLSSSEASEVYGIKPVITLKNTIGAISGDGTKENPYIIEKEDKELSFNSYVKLGNDIYTVYDKDEKTTKLVANKLVKDTTYRSSAYYSKNFDIKNTSSIAYYLNNTYYNSLTYKNNLVDCDFYTGDYTLDYKFDYQNIYKTKVTTKVGLLSIADVNLNNTLDSYFLLNKINNYQVASVNKNNNISINKVRPTVCINNNTKLTGNGTLKNPFELEV